MQEVLNNVTSQSYEDYLKEKLDEVFFTKPKEEEKEKCVQYQKDPNSLGCYYVDESGNPVNDQKYDSGQSHFCDGFAEVGRGKKCNFINTKGELLSKNLWFEREGYFVNGLAPVRIKRKWYYINTDGIIVTKKGYAGKLDIFYDGYVCNTDGKKTNWLDRNCIDLFDNGLTIDDYLKSKSTSLNKNFFEVCYALKNNKEILKGVLCKTIDMKNYQVEKTTDGYRAFNSKDSFFVKYEPIKLCGAIYVLCLNQKNSDVYLYNRKTNEYINFGCAEDVMFDDNIIIDGNHNRMYLVISDLMLEITEYCNRHLKGLGMYWMFFKSQLNEKPYNQENISLNNQVEILSEKEYLKREAEKRELLSTQELINQNRSIVSELEERKRRVEEELSVQNNPRKMEMLRKKRRFLQGLDNDLRGCNFEGIHFSVTTNFANADVRGAKFESSDDPAKFEINPFNFLYAICDEDTTLNGIPILDLLKEIKKERKR